MATQDEYRQQIVDQVEEDHDELKTLLVAFLLVGGTYLTVRDWQASRLAQKPRLMKRVNRLLAEQNTRLINSETLQRLVSDAWTAGEQQIGRRLTVADEVAAVQAEATKKALVQELQTDLTKLRVGMLRSSDRQLTELINEAAGRAGNGTPLQDAIGEAVEQLRKQGVAGIIDRSGRRWRPETFTDLCVRVTQQRSVTQGKLDACRVNRVRFVKVVGGTAESCGYCKRLEGLILTVTAPVAAPAVMTVDDAINLRLFHPRCTHSIDPWIPTAVTVARTA